MHTHHIQKRNQTHINQNINQNITICCEKEKKVGALTLEDTAEKIRRSQGKVVSTLNLGQRSLFAVGLG